MTKATGDEPNVVEIDAMDVDEWDRDRHTPRAHDANLAALVKQSASTDEPKRTTSATTPRPPTAKPAGAERATPARVPTSQLVPERASTAPPVDDEGWEDAAKPAEPPKTSQNTVRRTSAIPIMQPEQAAVAPPQKTAVLSAMRASSQPATEPAKRAPAVIPKLQPKDDAKAATPTKLPPAPKKEPAPLPAPTPTAPAAAAPPKRSTSALPAASEPKRPPPAQPAAASPSPATAPKQSPAAPSPATAPKQSPAAPSPAAVPSPAAAPSPAATPPLPVSPSPAVATHRSPAAASPRSAIGSPASPPQPAATKRSSDARPAATQPSTSPKPPASATNALAGPPPSDQFGDVVDLDAKAPRRTGGAGAQSPVVLQTSEQNTMAAGVFVMPTAAPPMGAPSPIVTPVAQPTPQAPTAFVPMPPQSAPPSHVPSAVHAAGIPQPLVHVQETERRVVPRSVLATVLPTPQKRRIALIVGGAVVLVVVLAFALGGSKHDSHAAPIAEPATTRAPEPTPARPAPVAIAEPAPTPHPDPATPPSTAPAPKPAPTALRSKKPVVVDYDKQNAETPLDRDDSLARARTAYATGNQHLFAGDTGAAISAYRQALATYPNYAAGYRGLGLAFSQKAFKTYLNLAPTAKDVALIKKRIAGLSAL